MRTKNIKRLWPVPMTLTVVALAAFLAFGLLTTSGLQPVAAVDADDCDGIASANAAAVECDSMGDSVDVTFNGPTTGDAIGRWVYVTGGDDHENVKVGEDGDGDDINRDLDEHALILASGEDALGNTDSETIAVNRSQADSDGVVHLYVYAGDASDQGFTTEDKVELSAVVSANSEYIVTVTFFGAPADYDEDSTNGSQLTIATASPTGTSTVTISVEDANGNGLDGYALLTLVSDDADVKFTASGLKQQSFQVADGVGATARVEGLPEEGALNLEVTAAITAVTGSLTITGDLIRVGDPASIMVAAYACEAVLADDDLDTAGVNESTTACWNSHADADNGDEVGPLGPLGTFFISGTAADAVGNSISPPTFTVEEVVPEGAVAILGATPAVDSILTVDADAAVGGYDITVTSGDVVATISIVVTGPAAEYSVDGPDWIALDGFAEYTLSMTDDNGNPPSSLPDAFDETTPTVNVLIQGVGFDQETNTLGLGGADGRTLAIDTADFTGTFSIVAPIGATQGQSVTVRVILGSNVLASKTIMFGEEVPPNRAPMAGDAIAAQTVTAGNMVTVASDITDADGDTLAYSASSSDDTIATASVADNGMVTITGVAAGSAIITVMATDPDGESASQTIAVMVEVPPNQVPMAGADIDDQTVIVDEMVTVASDITDADGDTLTYSASSSDDTIATASVADNGMVTITGVAAGSAIITVMATDPDGASASQTIAVMVNVPPNQVPMAGAAIADQTVTAGDMVMVASDITDADGDMLTYSASSSDDTIATASVADDGMVTITGVAAGSATITVMATDPDGASASQTIAVMVEAFVAPVLGDASGLMAAAGADAGTVELTWTPGPNATRHFVAGVKQSDLDAGTPGDSLIWTFADNPDSHTVTGLDSGEVYLFVVIAGDDDGWGDWTALEMVTPS